MTTFEERALKELTRIADALTILSAAVVMDDPEPDAVSGCQHPDDQRVDLGGGEWQCGVETCRFHFTPELVTT